MASNRTFRKRVQQTKINDAVFKFFSSSDDEKKTGSSAERNYEYISEPEGISEFLKTTSEEEETATREKKGAGKKPVKTNGARGKMNGAKRLRQSQEEIDSELLTFSEYDTEDQLESDAGSSKNQRESWSEGSSYPLADNSDSDYVVKAKKRSWKRVAKKPKNERKSQEEDEFVFANEKSIKRILLDVKQKTGVTKYLVLYSNCSYHVCEWKDESYFYQDFRLKRIMNYYTNKKASGAFDEHTREFPARFVFNPAYLQVEKIFWHRILVKEIKKDQANLVRLRQGPEAQITPAIESETANSINQLEGEGQPYVTEVDLPGGEKSRRAVLENENLNPLLRKALESSRLDPSRVYTISVIYLVKWNCLNQFESTWEKIPNGAEAHSRQEGKTDKSPDAPDSGKTQYEITRFTPKKAIESYLCRSTLREAMIAAAKKYEKASSLEGKLERLGLNSPPREEQDPRSVRMNRPSKLNGGIKFEDWQPPQYKNGNKLKKPYQEQGVRWLIYNWHMKRNCILADEMGLGKTIQTIAFTEYLFREQKVRSPCIVIAPKTTIQNWLNEFNRWTDFNVIVFEGIKENREIIKKYEFFFQDEARMNKNVENITKFDVILTSYGTVLTESILSTFDYSFMVVDEAHRLKNPDSKLYITLTEYKAHHMFFLTGTPLQNEIAELWALLSLLEPSIFQSVEEFEESYGAVEDKEQSAERISLLHTKVLKPFMLRRVKNDVALDLPPPKEVVIWLRLTREQKKYFKAIFEQNTDFLHAAGRKNAPSLQNIYMQLRHCCNHPFILRGVEERTQKERGIKDPTGDEMMKLLVQVSCKMDFLDKFLPMMKSQGHKVLIFSQFKLILNIIEDYLIWKNHFYERIDGDIDLISRQNSIDRFNADKENFVFLLSTRAGGLGINLTSADTVIIYDSDWNPQNDLQAQARAHRIGQTKPVTIYRLITKGSYEEVMFQKAGKKLGLEKALLHSWIKSGREIEQGKSGNLNKDELEKLIKFGAYHVLKETEDEKPQSINDILASSEIVQEKEDVKEKETVFSQATFKNTLDDNLSLNDPNFWEKIGLPKRNPNMFAFGRRNRRQARLKFDNDEYFSSESEETQDESFNSEDGDSRLSKTERSDFETALLKFGYGRWDQIRKAAKINRSDEDCKTFALGFIKLYRGRGGYIGAWFQKSLKGDLLKCLEVQRKASREKKEERENENVILLKWVDKKKDDSSKDLEELFDDFEVPSDLKSKKWLKKRFVKMKSDELKVLEHLRIIDSIQKIGWKSKDNPKGISLPPDKQTSFDVKFWKPEHDKILLKVNYEVGYNKGFKEFMEHVKNGEVGEIGENVFSPKMFKRRLCFLLSKMRFMLVSRQRDLEAEQRKIENSRRRLEASLRNSAKSVTPKPLSKSALRAFKRILSVFLVEEPSSEKYWKEFLIRTMGEPTTARDAGVLQNYNTELLVRAYEDLKRETNHFNEAGKKEKAVSVTPLFEMTSIAARRMKARLELFGNIQKLLDKPNILVKLSGVRVVKIPTSTWKTPISDYELLKGIKKHGLYNWIAMRNDLTLPNLFKDLSAPIPKNSKVQARLDHVIWEVVKLEKLLKAPNVSQETIDLTASGSTPREQNQLEKKKNTTQQKKFMKKNKKISMQTNLNIFLKKATIAPNPPDVSKIVPPKEKVTIMID